MDCFVFSEDNSNSVEKLGKIETYVRQCNNLKERKIRPEKPQKQWKYRVAKKFSRIFRYEKG